MVRLETIDFNKDQWQEFVNKNSAGNIYYTPEFLKFVERIFRYKGFFYAIKCSSELIGIFPLFKIKSLLFGTRLASLPFSDSGGICFKDELPHILKQKCIDMALKDIVSSREIKDVHYIQIKSHLNSDFVNIINDTPYIRFLIPLESPLLEIEKKFSRSIKRNIKKEEHNLKIELCMDYSSNLLREVYGVYLRDIRKFGSPALQEDFFKYQWIIYKPKKMFQLFVAKYQGKIVGALTLLCYKKTVYAEHIMSLPEFNFTFPKVKLYYESIKWAKKCGFKTYDFCKARFASGVCEHKRRWGGFAESIDYSYVILSSRFKDICINYENPSYKIFKMGFRKMPLCLQKIIGPKVRIQLGI